MKNTFSPKQVARALNVSESSLKRWCDRGMIATVKTVGGHRRVSLPSVLEFVQGSGHRLVHPELLGLPALTNAGQRDTAQIAEMFLTAVREGDEERCRRIVTELFLAGRSMATICDEVIGRSINRAGDLWECGELEVYQERLGCEMTSRLIAQCRAYLPDPSPQAPLAVGATPSGDPYTIATQMAELVLRELGWNATSLGVNLPFETLLAAVHDKRPRLFWLSVSVIDDLEPFLSAYASFHRQLPDRVQVVVGGRALTEQVRSRMAFFGYCESMQHLRDLAENLRPKP